MKQSLKTRNCSGICINRRDKYEEGREALFVFETSELTPDCLAVTVWVVDPFA